MKKIEELFVLLQNEKQIFIQTHDFPDHDAVASAFALKHLLQERGLEAQIIHKQEKEKDYLQDSLKEMIRNLGIPFYAATDFELKPNNKIVLVDSSVFSKNVTDLTGDEVAVIDHHEVGYPARIPFVDIRPQYGACSTILYSYYKELKAEIPRPIATALLIGLLVDTAQMTRGVSVYDVTAFAELYKLADTVFVNNILRNKIQLKDLSFYRHALDAVRIRDQIAFCYFPEGCHLTLLAIIGDFFLTLREVSFTCLCAKNDRMINLSLRSEKLQWDAAQIAQQLLEGIGFGGGHHDMAGGIIYELALFNEERVYKRLQELLY